MCCHLVGNELQMVIGTSKVSTFKNIQKIICEYLQVYNKDEYTVHNVKTTASIVSER